MFVSRKVIYMKYVKRFFLAIIVICSLVGITSVTTAHAGSGYNIHGITRPMAERWAWWHFYTSNNGQAPNGTEKIPIDNQHFRVISWWTKGHKRIVVKILKKVPAGGEQEFRVYRVSPAGNLKLRDDQDSIGEGVTIWNIVSREYHSLDTKESSQQINSMSKDDLHYDTITPMQTAAAVLIYYDHVQNGSFVKKGLQENGFNLSQTRVTKKDLAHPGRGIAYGLKPINDNVQEYFYTINKKGEVYFYVNGNMHPFKVVKLNTIIKYINTTKQQGKVRQIAGMFHVEDVKPMRK